MGSTITNKIRKAHARFVRLLDCVFTEFSGAGECVEHELVILDDTFPHLLSAFRITEYNALLQHFKGAAVYSNGVTFSALGDSREFKEIHTEYAQLYPGTSNRVHFYDSRTRLSARLCYLMFLNNANLYIDYIKRRNLPFVLELYPGGGFHLNDEASDRKLKKVTSSPLLKKIIVTQKISYEYLIEKKFCQPEQVKLIYGGVFPQEQLVRGMFPRKYFPADKKTFDICFVAHKYMPHGRDKGYDVFIESARILVARHPETVFHVVGPFGPDDMPVAELGSRIKFYGSRTTEFFPAFYGEMDLILSPNVPFVLRPGAFDGFPTGACIEAAICGVALFCCDELKLNPFVDGEELVVIPPGPADIAGVISKYIRNPVQLYHIARHGQQRFTEVFSYEQQMMPRIKLLEEYLCREGGS